MCAPLHRHPIISLDWTHFNDSLQYFISAHPREREVWLFQVAITIIDGSLESLLNAIVILVGSQET